MAGKGGGAWKVAYADFVTAMMAFFLVMWITGQNKPIKESVAKYFNDPFGGPTNRPNGGSYQRSMDNGDAPFSRGRPKLGRDKGNGPTTSKKRPAPNEEPAGRLPPRHSLVLMRGNRSYVGTVVHFPDKSAELDEDAREQLGMIATILAGKPNKIEIRGHATRRPLPGSPFHNTWELCYARCQATLDALCQHGIASERIRLSQAGPYEPLPVAEDQNLPSDNSRVEVYMLGEFIDELPEADEAPVEEKLSRR